MNNGTKKKNFQELINGEKPVLVDFYADWCGPCHAMKPILEDFKHRIGEKATVLKIDVDRNPAVAQAYRIQGIPTMIIFKQGKIVWRQSGVLSADQLGSAMSAHLDPS